MASSAVAPVWNTIISNISAATQFFQLRGDTTGSAAEILEIIVFQTGATALDAMNGIHIERGTGGTTGAAQTEDEWMIDGPAANFAAADVGSAFGVQVGTVDWNYRRGWNFLQEFVWLPTPEVQIWLKESDDLALSLIISDTLTIGYSITWVEYLV